MRRNNTRSRQEYNAAAESSSNVPVTRCARLHVRRGLAHGHGGAGDVEHRQVVLAVADHQQLEVVEVEGSMSGTAAWLAA